MNTNFGVKVFTYVGDMIASKIDVRRLTFDFKRR